MTGDVFLSNEKYLQQQDFIKAKQQRIIQVREKSKKMAAAIVNRMKIEADRQYQQTENRFLSEIRQHYSRELASVRQHYHQCINDINRQHYVNHVNRTNSSDEKEKQLIKISRNERNTHQAESKKQVAKKSPESQNKETELKKIAADSSNTKKTPISSSMAFKINYRKLNKPVTEKISHLLENIIIEPKETNVELWRDGRQSRSLPPRKKNINTKKSTNFLSNENLDVDKLYPSTSPVKRYPVFAKKPTLPNSNKIEMNKITEPQIILDNDFIEHVGNEIYNRLVHDRIRVLEQKEKILCRQSTSTQNISSCLSINKPARFSEYFSNARITDTSQKHPAASNESPFVNLPTEILNKSHRISTEDISNDVDRVEKKKKLLVLELSNAETQTDQNVPSNSNSTSNDSNEEIKAAQNVEFKKSYVQSARKSRSPRKISCLDPIPKKVKNSDTRTVKSKKLEDSENHRCKQKLLKSNGVVVTVSSNPSVSKNSSDSTSSSLENSYPTNVSSLESNIAHADHNHSQKTVQVVVNVLSNSEFKERKSKCSDRQKNIVYAIPENQFKKVPNWRKLFDNEEKMTESSYFSPPEVVLRKQDEVHSVKFHNNALELDSDEKHPNLGYYIQKLLLMQPESIENLDVSSCSTVTIDEVIQPLKNKLKKKSCFKLPRYQNSFDDTKIVKKSSKLPYYPNSFDDTIDAVCDFVLKSQCNDTASDDTSCVDDESVELFSLVNDDQNLSSMSDSSILSTENVVSPTSILKKPEKVFKSPRNVSDPNYMDVLRSVENEPLQDEIDDLIELPSVEELCKRGFVSEQLFNQTSADEQETMEEEEFLQQLLSIGQSKAKDETARRTNFKSFPNKEVPYEATEINASQIVPEDAADKVDAAIHNADNKLKTSTSDLKKENRLLGWMGTTVQRTLQASAINSTSSGDSSDPMRHTSKTLENLIEEPLNNSSENNSLFFHKNFTLSPIKVPDIHLTISPVLKDSD